jgi:hypothetical protein
MSNRSAIVAALIIMAPASISFAQSEDAILDFIDGRYEDTAQIARAIWEYAEVGYQETKSSGLLQQTLDDAGFSIEVGVASIPTAFVASHGDGGPVIAIMAELRQICRPRLWPQPVRCGIGRCRNRHQALAGGDRHTRHSEACRHAS